MSLQAQYEAATEARYQAELSESDARSEAVDAIVAEMTAGDDLLEVIADLSPQDFAAYEVAQLRWFRGDRQAMEAVRPMLADAMRERAEREYAKRVAA